MYTKELDKVLSKEYDSLFLRNSMLGRFIGIVCHLNHGIAGTVWKICYPYKCLWARKIQHWLCLCRYEYAVEPREDGCYMAVKEQQLSWKDKKYIHALIPLTKLSQLPLWIEYTCLRLTNALATQGVCPFFFTYVRIAFSPLQGLSFIFMDLRKGSLYQLLQSQRFSDDELLSLILQVYVGIFCMYMRFGIIHSDIHVGNILYHNTAHDCHWRFFYNDTEKFVIANHGIQCTISDFGLASIPPLFYNDRLLSFPFYEHKGVEIVQTTTVTDFRFITRDFMYLCPYSKPIHELYCETKRFFAIPCKVSPSLYRCFMRRAYCIASIHRTPVTGRMTDYHIDNHLNVDDILAKIFI